LRKLDDKNSILKGAERRNYLVMEQQGELVNYDK